MTNLNNVWITIKVLAKNNISMITAIEFIIKSVNCAYCYHSYWFLQDSLIISKSESWFVFILKEGTDWLSFDQFSEIQRLLWFFLDFLEVSLSKCLLEFGTKQLSLGSKYAIRLNELKTILKCKANHSENIK